MKIAIDGRVLNGGAGVAVYTRSVLAAWQKMADHQYVVYGYQPTASESWPANWLFRPVEGRLKTFRKLSEDVLFSPSSYLTTIVSNRPTLTTIHDLVIYKVAVKLPLKTVIAERFLLKRAVRRSAALTVQTNAVRRDLLELFPFAETKTYTVAPGVASTVNRQILPTAIKQTQILSRLQITKPYFLCVGTLEPRKNLVRLLEAYRHLAAETQSRYQLVLAGKVGWTDGNLKNALADLPAGVIATGRVTDQQLSALYAHSTAVVYPSLYEGVGYPVLEGFYWGKPVITSHSSSLAEVGEGAAILVNPYQTEELSTAMQTVVDQPSVVEELVTAGQAKLAQYSWQRAAESYLEILGKIQ